MLHMMSVEKLQNEIRGLSANELTQLTEWLCQYLANSTQAAQGGWQETTEQVNELERRLAEFQADPNVATPFEPDYFNNLKRRLIDERAQKASSR